MEVRALRRLRTAALGLTLPIPSFRRRAMVEFESMVLHEHYFGSLKPGDPMNGDGPLAEALARVSGSAEAWRRGLAGKAALPGIDWAILYHDVETDQLFNVWWMAEHEVNHPLGLSPILVLDVFEHAYLGDYGAGDRITSGHSCPT